MMDNSLNCNDSLLNQRFVIFKKVFVSGPGLLIKYNNAMSSQKHAYSLIKYNF